jgi:hypothetical protein
MRFIAFLSMSCDAERAKPSRRWQGCSWRFQALLELREARELAEHRASEPLPASEPCLGLRTALTFPLLPPPQKN